VKRSLFAISIGSSSGPARKQRAGRDARCTEAFHWTATLPLTVDIVAQCHQIECTMRADLVVSCGRDTRASRSVMAVGFVSSPRSWNAQSTSIALLDPLSSSTLLAFRICSCGRGHRTYVLAIVINSLSHHDLRTTKRVGTAARRAVGLHLRNTRFINIKRRYSMTH
jgi:hypothetical protein